MPNVTNKRPVILTGDRTTGPLHLGHYVGSLKNRVTLQHTHEQFLLLADTQALTDNAHDPEKVRRNVLEVAFDYLAVGIDPALTTICVQSALPALAELTMLYMNFVSVARLERNPTIKTEIQLRGFERDVPVGFLCYPVAQAADITAFKATLVPVGADQAPLIEQTNEIVRRLNRQIGHELLSEAQAMIPTVGRLPGIDGKAKMSKSQGNAVLLSASPDEIRDAVRQMYTDPNHIRPADPGTVEGNVVFTYLDAFGDDPGAIQELKTRYRRGGLGDMVVKRQLEEILQSLLAPIRKRRARYAAEPAYVMDMLRTGTAAAKKITEATLQEVRDGLGLFSFA
ncbi:tryptophan--tRNA ligase [Rhizobium sp. VS19-DR104.2]|uniref:tryptophan--tRNA ligase n=1 Tax=unclassified Rhizobium TaxID=2613769 RepID=UPI001C5AAE0A|nr:MULTISPECIES: tryptophan--tRNA ligase [unclassified Rhizobium]MBZ5762479.1 tryptophan--tRNA ligase [Rhizobium sp. VS19-DR96]MBZ5768506.1 tryptophan--tRNA ligase [Rhizobium sp. VS19-DR129.2]MBZ5776024.1 tryptophan--tRNA ligase [Rhizobium sp. VS19-DRK62.2]MBZ5787204.1 tryptophan--tRNA ligase [Rhizobium sp. VS19-DR121]MBZ5804557.1 tryptophan--tRNA ligase [Rhizobium sp. VS19-DR181]